MLEAFFNDQADRYQPTTLEATRRWLEHLQAFANSRKLSELTPEDLAQWRKELTWQPGPSGRNYSENTVNQAIGAARLFYRWALEQGHITKDPVEHLKTRRPPAKKKSRPTAAEARRILENVDPNTELAARNRALIGLILETGISRPGCARIDLEHLQLDTGALLATVRGRAQVHSLSEGLLLELRSYLSFCRPEFARVGEQALFVNRQGNRMTAASIQQILRTYSAT